MKVTQRELTVNLIQLVAALIMVVMGHPYIGVAIATLRF